MPVTCLSHNGFSQTSHWFHLRTQQRSRQQWPMVSRHVAAVTHRLYDRLPSMGTFWAFSLCTHFLPYLPVSATILSHGLRYYSHCHADDALALQNWGRVGRKPCWSPVQLSMSIPALVHTHCICTLYGLKTILKINHHHHSLNKIEEKEKRKKWVKYMNYR